MASKMERFLDATFKRDDTMSIGERAELFDSMTEKEREMTRKVIERVMMKKTTEIVIGYMQDRVDAMGIRGTSLDPFASDTSSEETLSVDE